VFGGGRLQGQEGAPVDEGGELLMTRIPDPIDYPSQDVTILQPRKLDVSLQLVLAFLLLSLNDFAIVGRSILGS
jgi:hypothetical protein